MLLIHAFLSGSIESSGFPMELVACTLSCPFIPCPPWQIHFSEPWIPSSTTCLASSGFSLSCHGGQAFLQASKTTTLGQKLLENLLLMTLQLRAVFSPFQETRRVLLCGWLWGGGWRGNLESFKKSRASLVAQSVKTLPSM